MQHILVLAGGLSHEREVSLRSGARLATALRGQGLEVSVRDADGTLLDWLAEHRPDAAVIAMHGGRGEDGSVQTVLQMAGIPFVGTAAASCRLAWDKPTAKALLSRAGFMTPPWVALSHSSFRDYGATGLVELLGSQLGYPLLIKPHQGGSALGATVVRSAAEMPAALVGSFAYGETVLAERFVPGVEVAVSVLDDGSGPVALPGVEIVPPGEVFDYEARYTPGLTTYHTPARLDPDTERAVAELAVAAHRTLGLADISRTDAIVDPSGTVYFLEVNVSPGLTETSMLPMSIERAGRGVGEVYRTLIDRAISRG